MLRRLLAMGCLAGMLAGAGAAPPLRVGLMLPLSGGSADFGSSARFGAELAVLEINQVGGYMGRPLELVMRDDRADPATGRKMAQELVQQEKVDFTVGICNTGVAMATIDVFQEARHLLMVSCSTGSDVTRKVAPEQSYVFRVSPTDAISIRFLVREIVQKRRIRQLAVFADHTAYGENGLRDLLAELGRLGLEPVYVARFPVGVTGLAEEMRRARAAGAQALVGFTVGPEHGVIARSRAEIGWQAPYFAPWPLSFRSALERAGPDALEGTMMVQSIIHDTANERRAGFLARYYAHSKDRPIGSLMAAAQTYDAIHLMLRALFASRGDTSGPALKKALENLDKPYPGVVTTYDRPFSATDHEAMSINMIWLGVWRRGEIQYLDARDAQRSAIVRRKGEANN